MDLSTFNQRIPPNTQAGVTTRYLSPSVGIMIYDNGENIFSFLIADGGGLVAMNNDSCNLIDSLNGMPVNERRPKYVTSAPPPGFLPLENIYVEPSPEKLKVEYDDLTGG